MVDPLSQPCTAFEGSMYLVSGSLSQVTLQVKAHVAQGAAQSVLIFNDADGAVIDVDFRGDDEAVLTRLAERLMGGAGLEEARGRGRPKLGVVAREVTLLPRHWVWLNAQPGGASVALRKLVEEARRSESASRREAQERAFRFMSAMAGDAPGYEEALRALYAADGAAFITQTEAWPEDVRDHARRLAATAFQPSLQASTT